MDKSFISKENLLKMSLSQIFNSLNSSENGLSQVVAEKRLSIYGLNVFQKHKVEGFKILFRQFKNSLTYLLLAASLISYFVKSYFDGTIILIILLVNALFGFFQEYKAEKTIGKLQKFISCQARLKRDGQFILLDQSKIVPGDVITIKEGDIVPADIRLIDADNLQIDESQLTGESTPVLKDKEQIVFQGSIVDKGAGQGLVFATGYNTEFGNIALLSSQTKRKTQYEKSLESFSSFLIKIVFFGLAIVFVFKLFIARNSSDISQLLLFIITAAVISVPEVLPAIATVSLSKGALKMAKKHVVLKRLSSLEDLGNVDLLCTDKTGTITENKMSIGKISSRDKNLFELFAFSTIVPLKHKKRRTRNSYDDAFIDYASPELKKDSKNFEIIKEIPFDPDERRRRVVLKDSKNKKYYLVVIGAPETLLKIARKGSKKEYLKEIEEEGRKGLHHLALAFKEINYSEGFDILKSEKGLVFLGYASFKDPLRSGAKNAILQAEKLGIKIKILTGDRKEVAEYVGKETGTLKEGDKIYIGEELEKMPEKKFREAVLKYDIFARVSPRQKYDIIKILKETNIVAYQGDGINDAPALKLADVSIAVNSATDIAKESSDIVILNESLEVIINGIKYGRSIFVNINKYIKYTMINNFGSFIALSILYLISLVLPMLPLQILLTNVITDIPLVSVSSDSVEDQDVSRPEKHNVKDLMIISLILGAPTALFELFYFMTIKFQPERVIQTSLFIFFSFIALITFYSIRSKRIFWQTKSPPKLINILFFSAFLFFLAVIYIPKTQQWFSFAPLPFVSIIMIIFLMLVYFLVIDIIKVWYYKKVGV